MALLATVVAPLFSAYGENRVADWLRYRLGTETVRVEPGRFVVVGYNLKRGDKLELAVQLSDESIRGIGAVVCPADEFEKYSQGLASRFCAGFPKTDEGGAFVYEAVVSGKHVFAIDNSFALMFGKTVTYETHVITKPDTELAGAAKAMLDDIYSAIDEEFSFPAFDMSVEPCYDTNAFSDNRTGNITLCSELLFESGRLVTSGAIQGILFHEFAHTLLNLWGQPNWQNEQTADELSAVLLVLAGRSDAMEDYVAYFVERDTMMEAAITEQTDSPHPLSIQRARNVSKIIDEPDSYVKRWIPLLYRHMEIDALKRNLSSANKYVDTKLGNMILAEKLAAPK